MSHLYASLVLAIAATIPAMASAQDKLIIGNEGTYPPFAMMLPSGQLTGIEPEIAREMCKRMNTVCEFSVMDFKALIPSLLQGKIDVVGSNATPTPERKAAALFGMPIVFNHDTFVVQRAKTYTFTKEGLKGVRIGLQRGASQAKFIEDKFGDVMTKTYYDNTDQIRLDLLAGRIDMTYGPKMNWVIELIDKPEGKAWKVSGDYWSGDQSLPEALRGSSWLVKKNNEALSKKMDAALQSMIEDCTLTKIRSKFLSVPILPSEAACLPAAKS